MLTLPLHYFLHWNWITTTSANQLQPSHTLINGFFGSGLIQEQTDLGISLSISAPFRLANCSPDLDLPTTDLRAISTHRSPSFFRCPISVPRHLPASLASSLHSFSYDTSLRRLTDVWLFRLLNLTNLFVVGAPISTSDPAIVLSQMRRLRPAESSFLAGFDNLRSQSVAPPQWTMRNKGDRTLNFNVSSVEVAQILLLTLSFLCAVQCTKGIGCSIPVHSLLCHSQVTIERDLVSQAEEEDMEALLGTYVMGIGEAEAFSERLKRELLALEAANVHALVECESIIEEDKGPYVAKAAKLKTEYTKKLAMHNKNQVYHLANIECCPGILEILLSCPDIRAITYNACCLWAADAGIVCLSFYAPYDESLEHRQLASLSASPSLVQQLLAMRATPARCVCLCLLSSLPFSPTPLMVVVVLSKQTHTMRPHILAARRCAICLRPPTPPAAENPTLRNND
ncbi:hypothetical protein ZIOFF_028547 [Zingiber officinale]|uniref:Uncharacterized protein n=1 Tax=Zingiber officinale TaxID=94328 RepID=A0A8J5LF26_ZINOF|nr:hypothetical protein ZIOFF_028547 [Zingiber officinale]